MAAIAILNTASGMSYAWIGGPTGFDASITGEVMNVTAGMKPDKANELVKRIMGEVDKAERKEMVFAVAFPEIYNLETLKPMPEYEAMILNAKDKLARLGVPFK